MKRIAVLAGVLAIAVAAPASAAPPTGVTTGSPNPLPLAAANATIHAGVTPGAGLATAGPAGNPATP